MWSVDLKRKSRGRSGRAPQINSTFPPQAQLLRPYRNLFEKKAAPFGLVKRLILLGIKFYQWDVLQVGHISA
jgi:hypothetical protein